MLISVQNTKLENKPTLGITRHNFP